MNKSIMNALISLLLISQFALISDSAAKPAVNKTVLASGVERIVATTKHKILGGKNRRLEEEATAVALETPKAIIALEKKDSKTAKEILAGVSTKLDGLLAKNPGLALLPADIDVDIQDYGGGSQRVASAIDTAKTLLKKGRLQEARRILLPRASEVRVTTISIPLGTFPAVIKQAMALIDAGKTDQAAIELDSGLNTFVETADVMPLPVLRAEELLTAASDLEHTKDLNQKQIRDEIQSYTDAAQDNLKVAELLGYGGKDDYKSLYQGIEGIDKTLFSEESDVKWRKVKDMLAALKDRLNALSESAERIGHPAK
jgi:hypothetical protein